MRTRRARVAFGIAMGCALFSNVVAAPALAQSLTPAEQANQARSLFEEGLKLAKQERWGEALEYFRRSRQLVERPSTIFNMGQALVRLGRHTEATTALNDYLRLSHPRQDAEMRTQAQHLLTIAAQSVAVFRLHVSPSEAEVRIDGRTIGGTGADRSVQLDPGEHTLEVLAPGYSVVGERFSVLPGARLDRNFELRRTAETRVVETRIVERRDSLSATVLLTVIGNVPNATLKVDGTFLGQGRAAVQVAPGPHWVEATAPGFRAYRHSITIVAGEPATVTARLEALPPTEDESILASPVFWAITGAVVVGAGITTAVFVSASGGKEPYGGSTGVVLNALTR